VSFIKFLTFSFLAGLFVMAGVAMLVPVLPVYFFDICGNKAKLGILMGIQELFPLIFRIQLTNFFLKAKRKKVLIMSVFVMGFIYTLYYFFKYFYFIIFLRLIFGFFLVGFFVTILTSVVENLPSDEKSRWYGYFTLLFVLPYMFFPYIGRYIYTNFGFGYLVIAVNFFLQLSIYFLSRIKFKKIKFKKTSASLYKFFKNNYYLIPAGILVFSVIFGDSSIGTFLPIKSEYLKLKNFSLFFTVFSIMTIISRFVLGKYFKFIRMKNWIILGTIFISFNFFLLYIFKSYVALFIAGIFYGLGLGIFESNMLPFITLKVKEEEKGFAVSLYSFFFDLGYFLGPLVSGFIAEGVSVNSVFLFAVIFSVFGMLNFIFKY